MNQAATSAISARWQAALSSVEFTLPSEAFEAKLISAGDGTRTVSSLETSTHFAVMAALQAMAAQSDVAQAGRLFSALSENSDRLLSFAFDANVDLAVLPVDIALHVAFARTAPDAAAPDRETLRLLATTVLDRFAKSKSRNPHVSLLFRLWTAAYAAWLAQDLELLQRAVATRGSIAVFPRQWALFQAVAKRTQRVDRNGVNFLRVDDAAIREEFNALFSLHRCPFLAQAQAAMPGERWFGGPVIGSYVYAWLQLQSYADEPAARTDWSRLGQLMFG